MGLLNRIKMLWRAAVGSSYSWPAMDIVLPGERYLHLVGSIHMGTRDMAPPPAKLLKKIRQADALIVEADISGNETPFSDLPTYPPLAERLSDAQLSELEARTGELGLVFAFGRLQFGKAAAVDAGQPGVLRTNDAIGKAMS